MMKRALCLLKRFARQESGMTLPLIAVSLMAMTGFVGTSVDLARAQLVQSKLSFALDAAGLAAGTTLNTASASAEVTKYLRVNFPAGYLGATEPVATVTISSDKLTISLSASTTLDPAFMQLFGHDKMTLTASSEIKRTASGLELVLVLDNTGSMNNYGKLTSLKTAATTLINILYGGETTIKDLWIGLVPFSQTVNIGSERTSWTDTTYGATLNWGPTSWAGCVDARWQYGRDITDATPTEEKFKQYYWSSDYNNTWKKTWYGTTTYYSPLDTVTQGPNLYCPQVMKPLTGTKTQIVNAITGMVAAGNTHIAQGLVWGWRMISPKWRGLWGGEMNDNDLPLDYATPHMTKAIVLLTDGANTMSDDVRSAYGYLSQGHLGTTYESTAVSKLNTKMTNVCTALKAKGVLIYTIALGNPGTSIQTLMKKCATEANFYFNSPSGSDLEAVFSAIGDSLSSLRVSK